MVMCCDASFIHAPHLNHWVKSRQYHINIPIAGDGNVHI